MPILWKEQTLMNKKPRKIHELIGKVLSKDLKKGYGHQENCPNSELKGGQ